MRALFNWMLCLCAAGCVALPTAAERNQRAQGLAHAANREALTLRAGDFDLLSYVPHKPFQADMLTVYLEGDGLAWISSTQVSDDPTPQDPLALRLALAQPDGASAWLARPCQYVAAADTGCPSRYWTRQRFAPEVIASVQLALDQLKQRFGARRLTLVGYSGGAAVAALVAARRTDVALLVSVAGNLDHQAWTALHRISPLDGSLNAASEIAALSRTAQLHLVGERDDNVPPALLQGFADKFPAGQRPEVQVVPGFDHHCCWVEQWPALWQAAQSRQKEP